jgi:hypothetical protein
MNDARRKEIQRAQMLIGEAKDILEVAAAQELDDFDKMPQDLQKSLCHTVFILGVSKGSCFAASAAVGEYFHMIKELILSNDCLCRQGLI